VLFAQILVSVLAGYQFVRTFQRWRETVRVVGLGRAVSGGALMARLRTVRPLSSGGEDVIFRWIIAATVPLLFELQVLVVAGIVVCLTAGRNAVLAAIANPLMIPVSIWALSHALESVVPPCLLYLGVSEPGQFSSFRYLASSRPWLAVSALDQGNVDVTGGERASDSVFTSFLLPGRFRGVPLSVFVQRRRLESVRTDADVWEGSVRRLIGYVPLIVADLRSHSTITYRELTWVLQAGAVEKLLLLTRDDGHTSVDPLLKSLGVEPSRLAFGTVTNDDLNGRVFQLLDSGRKDRRDEQSRESSIEAGTKLAALINDEVRRKEGWLGELKSLRSPSRVLDEEIWAWAMSAPRTADAPPLTRSISAAVELINLRLGRSSYSLHIGTDKTVWVDLGVQTIPGSFRVSVSGMDKPVHNAAVALLMALFNAELGRAWGRSSQPEQPLRPAPRIMIGNRLADAAPLLKLAEESDGTRNPELERGLFAAFDLDSDSLARNDPRTLLDELQSAMDAVQKLAAYSMEVKVSVGLEAATEVARPRQGTWLIALSHPHGRPIWRRPAIAVLIAALKAESGAFDGMKR